MGGGKLSGKSDILLRGGGGREPIIDYHPIQGRYKVILLAVSYYNATISSIRIGS